MQKQEVVNITEDPDNDQYEPKKKGADELFDHRKFNTTTDKICEILIKLLRENDNSENAFDDCFMISKQLKNLGKLNNFTWMPAIATEIVR